MMQSMGEVGKEFEVKVNVVMTKVIKISWN